MSLLVLCSTQLIVSLCDLIINKSCLTTGWQNFLKKKKKKVTTSSLSQNEHWEENMSLQGILWSLVCSREMLSASG